jgi:hypothetical protein
MTTYVHSLVFLMCLSCALFCKVEAAEMQVFSPRYSGGELQSGTIKVTGAIEQGDLNRLKALVNPNAGESYGYNDASPTLQLDSLGGSFREALAVGEYIRRMGISTRVAEGDECYSACAIIFMYGTVSLDGEEFPRRLLDPAGRLGFHAPYLELPSSESTTSEMVEQSYRIALLSVADLVEGAGDFFPQELLFRMLRVPPDQILEARTYGDLAAWNIKLDASQPPLTSLTLAQMTIACRNTALVREGRRPMVTLAEAQMQVDQGYSPTALGRNSTGDDIYFVSIDDMNSVGCNLGVAKQDDGTLRVRYYGSEYALLPYDKNQLPQSPQWTMSPSDFISPEVEFIVAANSGKSKISK